MRRFLFILFSLLLNLSSFNPHFPRAWLNPQMKLMKLSLIMLPWQDIWQKQSWEQREHGDETHRHTLGSELNWVTRVRRAQSFIPRPFVLFHHRLELCSTAQPRNLQKKNKMDEPRKKRYSSRLCSATNNRFAWLGDVEMSHHQSVLKTQTSAYFSSYCSCMTWKLDSAPFPLHHYYNSLFAPLTSLIICEFVYAAHLNIAVNKLVHVLLEFVVLHD